MTPDDRAGGRFADASVDERLFAARLRDRFDAAVLRRDRPQLIELLLAVDVRDAEAAADEALLAAERPRSCPSHADSAHHQRVGTTVSFSFALPVDEDGWPPAGVECFPFLVVPNGYRLLVAPLFVGDLSENDVLEVTVDQVNGLVLEWRHVVRSEHSTIWLLRLKTTPSIADALARLRAKGCATSSSDTLGVHSISVPPTVPMPVVDAVLDELDEQCVAIAYSSLRHPDG